MDSKEFWEWVVTLPVYWLEWALYSYEKKRTEKGDELSDQELEEIKKEIEEKMKEENKNDSD